MTAQLKCGGYPADFTRPLDWDSPVSAEILSVMRVQHGPRRGQLWERLAEFEVAYDLRHYKQRFVLGDPTQSEDDYTGWHCPDCGKGSEDGEPETHICWGAGLV